MNKIRPFSFCGLLILALLGLDNSVVSFNANSAIYLEEEIDILWGEQDPAGQEIFLSRMHQRLPEWEELFKEAVRSALDSLSCYKLPRIPLGP